MQIVCTGQKPNSGILDEYAPEAISKTQRILVRPTLQLQSPEAFADEVFALGDVAETGGPKMARAAFFQSLIVSENIVSMIRGGLPSKTYQPKLMIEGSIKLTLGKVSCVHVVMKAQELMSLIGSNVCLRTGSRWQKSRFHGQ